MMRVHCPGLWLRDLGLKLRDWEVVGLLGTRRARFCETGWLKRVQRAYAVHDADLYTFYTNSKEKLRDSFKS